MDKWHADHTFKMKTFMTLDKCLDPRDFCKLSPPLVSILTFIYGFCAAKEITLHITSLIRSPEYDKKLGSKSKTHQDGRAFDFSIKSKHGWTYETIQHLINLVNENFKDIGAINLAGESRPIIIHKNLDGSGDHSHVQVRRNVLLPFM